MRYGRFLVKMGLFDYINFDMECPKCGKKIIGFQSKDGPCLMCGLTINDVNNFYSSCPNCDIWVEFNRKITPEDTEEELLKLGEVLEDFDMKVKSWLKS